MYCRSKGSICRRPIESGSIYGLRQSANLEIFAYVGCFTQKIENITWPHGGKIIGPRCFVSR